jgi:two-component system sensor histidine kinase KdpD
VPERPDPDALLEHVSSTAAERKRGRLKVFFGAMPGVGKTYAMLEEARALKAEGVDVMVGLVETHGRTETQRLIESLEVLPRRATEHRGVSLTEFDLEAALARAPKLVLVDELAHTNVPGSRHARRYQDVEELLAAGIDVFTTLNVQHLESLNDVVAQITHVRVRETVPDSILDEADEVKLVDLPPEQLLKRLREGKVYIPEQARRASENFFKVGNIIALRQLALRYVAGHVDADMQVYRRAHGVAEPWRVAERLLVGVGPAPTSNELVRAAKRLADDLDAEWIALFVETPEYANFSTEDRERVWKSLRLAEELGARTETISGSGVADLIEFARRNNVSKVLIGRPEKRSLLRPFGSKHLEAIIRASGDLDVWVMGSEEPRQKRVLPPPSIPIDFAGYGWAMLGVTIATTLGILLRERLYLGNIIMLYLLVVVAVAARRGRWPAIVSSVLSVAAFDFFCVPPYHTFRVADSQYILVFTVMLIVSLLISALTSRVQRQAQASRTRERRTAALLEVTRAILDKAESEDIVRPVVAYLRDAFETKATVLVPDPFGDLRSILPLEPGTPELDPAEDAVARWVVQRGEPAGQGTETVPDADALYLPLRAAGRTRGVLAAQPRDPARLRDPEYLHLVQAIGDQLASALERARLGEEAARARQMMDMNRLRSRFVATASQHLLTPVQRLGDAISKLRSGEHAVDPVTEELLTTARADVERLQQVVDDLRDIAHLESEHVTLQKVPVSPLQLLQRAARDYRAEAERANVHLSIEIDPTVPDVDADPERLADVLGNLLANAIHHTPPNGRVVLSADSVDTHVQFAVSDNGPGIPLNEQLRVFDEFVQLGSGTNGRGLGLAIARSIVTAHRGDIWVDSGPGPGSVFSFTIPIHASEHSSNTL